MNSTIPKDTPEGIQKSEGSVSYSEVLKHNPYHETGTGRFTTHSNSGFTSTWGKNYANIKAPENKNKVMAAALFQEQKAKEFAKILGHNVRGGSTDALGIKLVQSIADKAKFHATGAEVYGKHSTTSELAREGFKTVAAQAISASSLGIHDKKKLGLPITTQEKALVAEESAAVQAAIDKKATSNAKMKVTTAAKNLDKNFATLMHKASQAEALGKPDAALKHQAKIVELQQKMMANGATQAQMDAQMAKNDQHFEDYKAKAKSDIVDTYAKTLIAGKGKDQSMDAQADYTRAKEATNALTKQHKYLIKDNASIIALQALGNEKVAAHIDAAKKAHADALSTFINDSNNDHPEALSKLQEAKANLTKLGFSNAEISNASVDITANAVAKEVTGKTPVSMAQVLQSSAKNSIPEPVAESKLPEDKDLALLHSKAMGKQYYDMKVAGAGTEALDAAHKLYDQAKDHYVSKGGSKGEFSAISSDLKSKSQNEFNSIKTAEAKKVQLAALEQQKQTEDYSKAHKDWALSVLAGRSPEVQAGLKAKQIAAHDSLSATGKYSNTDIEKLQKMGGAAATTQHQEKEKVMLETLKGAHKALQVATLNGEDTTGAKAMVDVAHKMTKNHGVTAIDLESAKSQGVAAGVEQHKYNQDMLDAFGDPHKAAKMYDAHATTFESVVNDTKFRKSMKDTINNLPAGTHSTIKNYTDSGYKELNKEVGKFGTAKMSGGSPPPLSENTIKQTKQMDKAFEALTLGKNVNLRRNFPQKYLVEQLGHTLEAANKMTDAELTKNFVGKVYKETAFSSTSMDPKFSSAYSNEYDKTGGVSMMIRANKDTRGMIVTDISTHDTEHEIILARGTTYVIRKVERVANGGTHKLRIHADVIGTFPDKLEK